MWNLFHYRPILHGGNIFDHIENYFPLASCGFTYGTGLNTCSTHLASVKSISVLKCSESGFISGFFEGLYARMFCIALMILSVILWTRFEWYPYSSWPRHSLMYLRTHFWKPVRIWISVLWLIIYDLFRSGFLVYHNLAWSERGWELPVWLFRVNFGQDFGIKD